MNYKINTYGCQMNVHESEKVAGILESLGYVETHKDENADIIVFNTCCIRDTAEQRALGNIGMTKKLKQKNKNLLIVVLGCMTQQDGNAEMLKQKYPYVDIVLGTKNVHLLGDLVKKHQTKNFKFRNVEQPLDYLNIDEKNPMYRTSFPNAWINIMYGCNNFCTYCIVPYVRGREISRDMNSVLKEVKQSIDEGYKEITLLGQNVNSYGNDREDGTTFAKLLNEIDKIDGKFRVRFMTSHPKDLNDDVIDAIANSKHICKNIHLPVQAGSDNVLKDMNRRYTQAHYLNLIEKIRAKMPNCGITSDIMVGFPTETEEDFLQTMLLAKKAKYSTAFTFVYSPREGTPAAKMEQIPSEIKKDRIIRLVQLQNEITKEVSKTYIGNVFEVLVEDVVEKKDGYVCGRTDCGRLVSFKGDKNLIGQFVNVKVEEAHTASLFGTIA